jgi:AraC family transcriptional regulator, L-rhamnose operon transcriptional activator RhaR
MFSRSVRRAKVTDPSYLSRVQEVGFPLSERCPIWIRHGRVESGPPIPSPHRHPCYEFGIMLAGTGTELVGSEQAERQTGDVLLAAPGVPHWMEISEYPLDFVSVFFLPSLLIQLGAESDGLKILRRFTAASRIDERLVRPSRPLRTFLKRTFEEMAMEFDSEQFGKEVRLRTLLLDMLVHFIRWEQERGMQKLGSEPPTDWGRVHAALEYLHSYYRRPIYAHDVADAAGVTESQLKHLFRTTVGMSWVRYLQSYRIQQAAALLSQPDCAVLGACLAVGFETVSHFNAVFRDFMGVSPREYRNKLIRRPGE